MSERTKHLIATEAAALVLATPMVGHAGVTLALSRQTLPTERQQQTRGLEAERRVVFSINKRSAA
ncbi:MAG: hypothetical protein WA047_03980 [Phenylobacterium sp.]|uniref:hypothetical protein n=1 Tax=Phenylobacterium sp. TaxID=1871053 RepID=UPI003BB5BA13